MTPAGSVEPATDASAENPNDVDRADAPDLVKAAVTAAENDSASVAAPLVPLDAPAENPNDSARATSAATSPAASEGCPPKNPDPKNCRPNTRSPPSR